MKERRDMREFVRTHAQTIVLAGVVMLMLGVASCGTQKKVQQIQKSLPQAAINLPYENEQISSFRPVGDDQRIEKDTIVVNIDGHDMLIMKAIKDDETGEMVATEQIKAAVVTARFRNVAERNGKVDLQFEIRVPEEMYDPEWQLRFYPDMFILEDSIRLESVYVTGEGYRNRQLKGYEQYDRFLKKIIGDNSKFVDLRNLEVFLQRNIPQIYAFKTDSTEVSDEMFESCFGVSDKQAIDHYTNRLGIFFNERRKARQGAMYAKYIKAPIETEHIRLDTVMKAVNGEFVYLYTETINVRPKLRKVDIILSGDIYEQDKRQYIMPRSEPLTFYISSLSSFVDNSERYLKQVVSRNAVTNAFWNIDFKVGKADIEPALSDNARQIANIKENLNMLLTNETFLLDSITIAAFASPEGQVKANEALSGRRAESAAKYFNQYVKHVQDSIKKEAGLAIVIGADMKESEMTSAANLKQVRFMTSNSGENWNYLNALVDADSTLTDTDKESYRRLNSAISDLDAREKAMQGNSWYKYVRETLYPKLRTVQFSFFLHRKGVIKDTVEMTVLDSTYMRGVQAIRDRDYEAAVALLMPYNDYNTAIAYVSLDRNLSAMNILKDLKKTAPVNYMLAVLYSRMGDEQKAVQHYLTSCKQDGSYIHRGNLDPEIAVLIKKYNLNAAPDDDEFADSLPF